MLVKIIQFMVNALVFEVVPTGITNGMVLAESQSAIFILMLHIFFPNNFKYSWPVSFCSFFFHNK